MESSTVRLRSIVTHISFGFFKSSPDLTASCAMSPKASKWLAIAEPRDEFWLGGRRIIVATYSLWEKNRDDDGNLRRLLLERRKIGLLRAKSKRKSSSRDFRWGVGSYSVMRGSLASANSSNPVYRGYKESAFSSSRTELAITAFEWLLCWQSGASVARFT
jgi:hypothetical protein